MEAKVNKQSEFLEIVSNFNFDIIFHDEKNAKGKPIYDLEYDDWFCNIKYEYWDFDIQVNGYKIENLVTNWRKIKYGDFLENHLNSFIKEHDSSILMSLSKSDCYDLLSNAIEKLTYLNGLFLVEKIIGDQPFVFFHEIQMHRKVNINYSKSDLLFNYDGDTFLYSCIGSFISRKKEVIESAIRFLNMKLQWLDLRQEQTIGAITADSKSMDLTWCKTDTALLELVTALVEMKAISNSQNNLTRKEAIDTFSKIFGIEIKDAESKLSRATERKRDVSFPTALKESFDNYVIRKDLK